MKQLLLLALFATTSLFGNIFNYAGPHPIQEFSQYAGNEAGDFAGDTVVKLYDGSLWKVHPTHTDKVKKWEVSDEIHVQLRKSFYWFKREHKFRLHNRTKGESVKAMILDCGISPLIVFSASEKFPTCWSEVPIYAQGPDGDEIIVGYKVVFGGWKKVIDLTNGTTVEIRDHFDDFVEGADLYVGIDDRHGYKGPFLITGRGEKAVHTPVYLTGRDD